MSSQLVVSSLYGRETRQPIVQLTHGEWMMQVTPEEARRIARMLMESAEAAEQDGFLVEFMMKKVGVEEVKAVLVLHEYRQWRDARPGAEGVEPA